MRKTLISVAMVSVAVIAVSGAVYVYKKKQIPLTPACPVDVMMCPDGTSVARTGTLCEFGVCKQELPSYMQEVTTPEIVATTSSSTVAQPEQKIPPKTSQATTNIFTKITQSVSTVFKQATGALSKDVASGVKETSSAIANNRAPAQQNTQQPTSPIIDETRYTIDNGTIIGQNNTPIYTIPLFNNSSGQGTTTETHLVNVVPIGTVAPVIGAIPVGGLPGKYYLSENYFSGNEECKFANRIYILDSKTNTRTLMYEENSTTLTEDDPRACNNEMYLLATEDDKLILKYHTLDTNMECDSTWSEPEKTWYITVTRPQEGTRRYSISPALYTKAEVVEEQCRLQLEASSTPAQP